MFFFSLKFLLLQIAEIVIGFGCSIVGIAFVGIVASNTFHKYFYYSYIWRTPEEYDDDNSTDSFDFYGNGERIHTFGHIKRVYYGEGLWGGIWVSFLFKNKKNKQFLPLKIYIKIL